MNERLRGSKRKGGDEVKSKYGLFESGGGGSGFSPSCSSFLLNPHPHLMFSRKSSLRIHKQLFSKVKGLDVFPVILLLYAPQSPRSSEVRMRDKTDISDGRGMGGVNGSEIRGASVRESGIEISPGVDSSLNNLML